MVPKITIKLIENINIKSKVEAKLYEIISIKLCISININNV